MDDGEGLSVFCKCSAKENVKARLLWITVEELYPFFNSSEALQESIQVCGVGFSLLHEVLCWGLMQKIQ